eukprot:172253-Alexandrium_andersonii.AAC.1
MAVAPNGRPSASLFPVATRVTPRDPRASGASPATVVSLGGGDADAMVSDNSVRATRDMEQALGSHPEMSASKRTAPPPRL